jgi:hypothetical protein
MLKKMFASMVVAAMGLCGCTGYVAPSDSANAPAAPVPVKPEHPNVKIEGTDGTSFNGELLNGTVTIDSGQGPLTLLTDHIYSIEFASDGDTVTSKSVTVSGKIHETQFNLQTEHGVFFLQKERLRRIEFVLTPPPSPTSNPAKRASTHTTPPLH